VDVVLATEVVFSLINEEVVAISIDFDAFRGDDVMAVAIGGCLVIGGGVCLSEMVLAVSPQSISSSSSSIF